MRYYLTRQDRGVRAVRYVYMIEGTPEEGFRTRSGSVLKPIFVDGKTALLVLKQRLSECPARSGDMKWRIHREEDYGR